MPHSVFISYAKPDQKTAYEVFNFLKQAGISCWMAPDSILPSEEYDDAIIEGINNARIMVLIYTSAIFRSKFVKKEVDRANTKGKRIIPLRFDAVEPLKGWEFQLSLTQWMDALTRPLEPHLTRLVEVIQEILSRPIDEDQSFFSGRVVGKPPEPAKPPVPTTFVGRAAELVSFARLLETNHLVVICGMTGMGKTVFAAKLASQVSDPNRTFWHSFHKGESINILIKKVAIFLFYHGDDELWQLVQNNLGADAANRPVEDLIDFMFERIRGRSYLLCLDNFQLLEEDKVLDYFYERLTLEAARNNFSAIVVSSRQMAVFQEIHEDELLTGLSLADASELIAQQKLNLSSDLMTRLYEATGGNVQFLLLASDALKRSKYPSTLIDRLFQAKDIEAYLINTIYKKLDKDEARLISAVALFLDFPASQNAIRAVMKGRVIQDILARLVDRYLVNETESSVGFEYSLSLMMQSYFYGLLSESDQKAMHYLAGEFYSRKEPAPLQAALHFQHAGKDEKAITIVTRDVWAMLNLGQANILHRMLGQFTDEEIPALLAARLDLVRGQVSGFMGEIQDAASFYEAVQDRIADLPDEQAVRLVKARACRGLGELFEGDQPQKALEYLGCGIQSLAAGDSPAEVAALKIRIGRIHALLGNFSAAESELKEGLAMLPVGPSRARISAIGNLGTIASLQGNSDLSLDYYDQVLKIAGKMNDFWSIVEVELNIGIELDIAGHLAESAKHYQAALEQARHLGSLAQQARTLSSLGILHTKLGDYDLAEQELTEGIALARRANQQLYLVYYLPALADLHLRQGRPFDADPLLEEALRLADEIGAGEVEAVPEIHRLLALFQLTQKNHLSALASAEKAVEEARKFSSKKDEGIGLRVLGQVQNMQGLKNDARSSFEQSLSQLTDSDPYEEALSQLALGEFLIGVGETERGRALLQAAEKTFEKLGAKKELEKVRRLLK